jgi:hypothetical protein
LLHTGLSIQDYVVAAAGGGLDKQRTGDRYGLQLAAAQLQNAAIQCGGKQAPVWVTRRTGPRHTADLTAISSWDALHAIK